MTPTLKSLGIDELPLEQRLALFQELRDSIDADCPTPQLTEAKRQELLRRAAEYDANPDIGIPWEQVKAEALARLRQ